MEIKLTLSRLVSQAEMEINGVLLLDLDGGEVTMHAAGSDGMVREASSVPTTIYVPATNIRGLIK